MLALMSSFAALAHKEPAKAPDFNAIFYATVATVIPILFIAVALQADTYTQMIKISRDAHRRVMASTVLREVIKDFTIFIVTSWVPALVLVFGVWGEIVAFLDLYLQRPVGLVGPLKTIEPLLAVSFLAIATGIGPALKIAPLYYQVFKHDAGGGHPAEHSKTGRPAERDSPAGEATRDASPPPEAANSPPPKP